MYQEYLDFAKDIANKAKEITLKYFNEDNESSYKEDETIVTIADREINEYLIKRVKERYPDHSVDGEEEKFGEGKMVWVCDPVDGTAMYARHIPVSVFSLALVVDGESILGVVMDPFNDYLYTAVKGEGAYLNDRKIEVSDIGLGDMKSFSNLDMWPGSEYNLCDAVKELGERTYFVGLGSVIHASMCVASGEFNFAIFPGTKNKNFDIAAVKVIVEEAGGKVTDLFGDEQRYDEDINGAVVSNGIVHQEVVDVIKKYLKNKKDL